MPVTRHEHAQMRQQAPPVWDPRSPTAARTPKREIRNIRKSVVIQEQVRLSRSAPRGVCWCDRCATVLPLATVQLQQQIQEVKEREEKELRDARLMQQDPRQARGNRRTTEVASLPSRSERTRDERLASSTPKAAAAVSADAGAPVASTGVGAGATAPSTVPSGQRPPASTFALAKDHESVDENPSGMRSPLSAFVGQQLLAGVRDDVTTKTATASASTNASPALAVGQTAPLQPFPLSSVSRATLPPLKPLMELQAIPEGE
jgi:hypothetical protein